MFFDVKIAQPGKEIQEGRIVMGLFGKDVPRTVENFKQLVIHDTSRHPSAFVSVTRTIPGFICKL